jgi:hypothetical protein
MPNYDPASLAYMLRSSGAPTQADQAYLDDANKAYQANAQTAQSVSQGQPNPFVGQGQMTNQGQAYANQINQGMANLTPMHQMSREAAIRQAMSQMQGMGQGSITDAERAFMQKQGQ